MELSATAIQLVAALVGSVGYAMLSHIRGVKLLVAGLGGLLTWGIYLLLREPVDSLLVANLLAAGFAAAYAEIMARVLRAPATIFVMPAVITLVPGGALYYTMYSAIAGDAAGASAHGYEAWNVAVGVAIGIAAVTSVCNVLALLRRRRMPREK